MIRIPQRYGRIISGHFRHRIIKFPDRSVTRPTSDRVKKTMFDILTHNYIKDFSDYTVIDLFAGSGALGLESVSLGCRDCYMIDRDKNAIEIIKQNTAFIDDQSIIKVFCIDYKKFLDQKLRLITNNKILIFLDPPYADNNAIPVIIDLCKKLSKKEVFFVIERGGYDDLGEILLKTRNVRGKILTFGKITTH